MVYVATILFGDVIKCADLIANRLYHIYKAMIERGLYYAPWKHFTTVVLRKPGKSKYNVPKAYRPIALLNTMIKVLTAILAEQLMYYAEEYNLLPANHFGGRKGRTATDAVHLLVHNIKGAWRKGKVMAVLFLDIEGAFPNADNGQLTRNLRKRGIPTKLIEFVANMLKDRSTAIKFDDHVSGNFTLNNGIGQGDPLSMALYQFYNADLLDIPRDEDEAAIAYVDDAILTATASTFQQAHDKLADMMTRQGGAIEWTTTHNSKFEYSKLALIDFAHRSRSEPRSPLVLPSITITPSESVKYLGVILDKGLNWKEQAAYVAGKGSTWAAQIRRAVRPSWGLTPRSARKLYVGVAIPRILYGIEIWCYPARRVKGKEVRKDPMAATRKLATIQRQGALAITGGLRTSPTDALDAHASLLPMHLRLSRARHNAATRIAALPKTHPLHPALKRAASRRTKRHRSPLHHLADCLAVPPNEIENIPVVAANPALRQRLPFRISIPSDKETSKRLEANANETIRVFTDGSMHNDKVGAAAVLYRNGRPTRTLRLHMGPASQHTVYEAEMVGLLLGIHLIKTEPRSRTSCILGADNQAAIQALRSELNKPGQHLAAEILRTAKQLGRERGNKNYRLTIRWTAGHVGIPGNERADEEAKKAATGSSSERAELPRHLRKGLAKSITALRQHHNEATNKRWKQEWNDSVRFKRLKSSDTISPHSKKYLALISDHRISRRMASILFQLKVGHVPLNGFLHRIGKVDSPRCPACGEARETAEHFILRCPNYAYERWALHKHTRSNAPSLEDILSDPKLTIPLINYIEATSRFEKPD